MHKRRSHNKSRKGCTNCKKRHVKCDEQGPPCAACVARDTTETCTYNIRPNSPREHIIAVQNKTIDFEASTTHSSNSSNGDSDESRARRLIELKLMHRWVMHTWRCLHALPEDIDFLQDALPQACITHDYLLNSTLALAALDLVIHGDHTPSSPSSHQQQPIIYTPHFWLENAMLYYDLASQSFRNVLANPDPASHTWVYMSSIALTMVQMTLPACVQSLTGEPQPSVLSRLGLIIELFMGNGNVALSDWLSLYSHGPGADVMRRAVELVAGPPPQLPYAMRAATANLRLVVGDLSSPDSKLARPEYGLAYARVCQLLELSLLEEARGVIRGFCICVPMYCGRDFAQAVAELQPTALFLAMYFGALLECGARVGYWWANGIGSGLVLECVDILEREYPQLLVLEHWKEGVAWAQEQLVRDVDPIEIGMSLAG